MFRSFIFCVFNLLGEFINYVMKEILSDVFDLLSLKNNATEEEGRRWKATLRGLSVTILLTVRDMAVVPFSLCSRTTRRLFMT